MAENFAIIENTRFEDQIVPDKDITLPSDGSLNFVSNWASYVSEFVSFETNIYFSASRKKITFFFFFCHLIYPLVLFCDD